MSENVGDPALVLVYILSLLISLCVPLIGVTLLVKRQFDVFKSQLEEVQQAINASRQAYVRAERTKGCVLLLAVCSVVGVLIYDVSLGVPLVFVYLALSLVLEGYYARKVPICIAWPNLPFKASRWLLGEEARRQGSTQMRLGLILLIPSCSWLGWSIFTRLGV
jgi:uncharacterized membrane protein YhaH (DUF805 family)